jgi:hypothetical protein
MATTGDSLPGAGNQVRVRRYVPERQVRREESDVTESGLRLYSTSDEGGPVPYP